jgi:hypothetical protein
MRVTKDSNWFGEPAPSGEYVMGEPSDIGFAYYDASFLSLDEAAKIKDIILNLEQEVKNKYPSVYPLAPPDALTGRYPFFNWLNVPEFNEIVAPKLAAVLPNVLPYSGGSAVQCWANTLRKNEGIGWHRHAANPSRGIYFLCAHLFIDGAGVDSATSYFVDGKIVSVPNKVGSFSVFEHTLYHAVSLRDSATTRISVAMDLHPLGVGADAPERFYQLSFD